MSLLCAMGVFAQDTPPPPMVPAEATPASEELELLKEQETVSITTRHETETGVEFLATRWLSGFANLSYQQIGQTFTGVSRRGAPDWKAHVDVRGDWDSGLYAEVAVFYVASPTYPLIEFFSALAPVLPTATSSTVDSYTLLNFRGGYRFWHDNAEVAVSVFNALNDEHKEHPLGELIGRRVMGWLTLKL